jgi:hypothetical protein
MNEVGMHETLRETIERLLDGIDRDECDDNPGWWETSYGAKRGAKVKAQVLAAVEAYRNRDADAHDGESLDLEHIIKTISVLRICPGDVVVLSTKRKLSQTEHDRLELLWETGKERLGLDKSIKLMILEDGIELHGVIHPQEAPDDRPQKNSTT